VSGNTDVYRPRLLLLLLPLLLSLQRRPLLYCTRHCDTTATHCLPPPGRTAIKPTKLYATNRSVDAENYRELSALPGAAFAFECIDKVWHTVAWLHGMLLSTVRTAGAAVATTVPPCLELSCCYAVTASIYVGPRTACPDPQQNVHCTRTAPAQGWSTGTVLYCTIYVFQFFLRITTHMLHYCIRT
jgi:hypothetical protein